jgi:short/branched chain acyl-CoA dehydrogenase
MTFMESVIVIEELAKIDPYDLIRTLSLLEVFLTRFSHRTISVIVDVQNTLVNNALIDYATEDQKAYFFPKTSTSSLACFCLTEQRSGSDAFGLRTQAVKDGDHYVINGSKAWITNSGEADVFILFATVDPSKGYKGITAFLLERNYPGLEVGTWHSSNPRCFEHVLSFFSRQEGRQTRHSSIIDLRDQLHKCEGFGEKCVGKSG